MKFKFKLSKNEQKKLTDKERLEQRRAEVLAIGRKFKYPLQYTKHKLVVNTLLVATIGFLMVSGAIWLMLFKFQDTGDALYRLTKVLPIPVAEIDGEKLRYSDYLMIYRSSIIPVEQQGQLGSKEEEDAIRKRYKKLAMELAENYTYAEKKAKELGIKIPDDLVNKIYEEHRKVGGIERGEESFKKIVRSNFGLSEKEYKRMIGFSLMKAEVSKKIDQEAAKLIKEVEQKISSGEDLVKIAESMGEKVGFERTGLVDARNIDGGRAKRAGEMKVGEISEVFLSTNGDAYYVVKLIEKTEKEVRYESLRVGLLEFEKQMKILREQGKIKEYINLD